MDGHMNDNCHVQSAGNAYQEKQCLDRKRVVVTLSCGGFLWEARALIKGLGTDYDYHFVTTPDAG